MKHTNFDGLSPDEFRQLEAKAWKGTLDYSLFPAAEYKFFDTVATLGYRHRHEKIPAELLRDDITAARRIYERENSEHHRSREVYAEQQAAVLKADEMMCRIEKTSDRAEKLSLALECIGLITGDRKFAERNLRNGST